MDNNSIEARTSKLNPKKKVGVGLSIQNMNANLYHLVLPFDQFVEASQKLNSLEDKFNLLRQQFSFDPYQYDLGHTMVNSAAASQQINMINTLTFEQVEIIIYVLQDIIQNYINPNFQEEQRQNYNIADLLSSLSQIQSLIVIILSRIYTQLLISEFFDSTHYDSEKIFILQNAFDIIGDMTHYLLVYHSGRLRQGFKSQIQSKIQDCLTILLNHSENELFIRQIQQSSSNISSNIQSQQPNTKSPISNPIPKTIEAIQDQQSQISQSQLFKFKQAIFTLKMISSDQSKLKKQDQIGMIGDLRMLDGDRSAMESLIYSLILMSNSLFQDSINSKQSNLLDNMMHLIFLPLMQMSSSYETIYFDSFQNLQSKRRLICPDIYEFNILMHDTNTGKPYENYSLITLLLKSFQKAQNQISQHQTLLSTLHLQQAANSRVSKNLSLINRNEFQSQSLTTSQSFMNVKNDQVARIIDEIAMRQIYYYLIHFDNIRQEKKKQEEQKKTVVQEIKQIARPTIKRQKSLNMISITTNSLSINNSPKDAQMLSGHRLRVIKNPLNEIESPSVFVKKLVGQGMSSGGLGDVKTPTEFNPREPLQIDRITNDSTNQLLNNRDLISRKHAHTAQTDDLKETQDPIAVLSDGQNYRKGMITSKLMHSSQALSELSEARINWIRVSHLLLEISVDILKTSFCLDNEQIKLQNLFNRMFDLFKTTLYFVCSFQHYRELFHNIDDLIEIADTEKYPCFLANTFQIMMSITQSGNKNLIETFYDEYLDILVLLSKGTYEAVDKNFVLKIYYNLFFDKINTRGTPQKIFMTIPHLLNFFNSYFYQEHRIKDVETMNYLKIKKNYKMLMSKMIQQENSHICKRQSNSKAEIEINKILFQQQIIETISYLAHYSQKANDLCWREIDRILNCDYSVDLNQTKLYQYMKLVILIMRNEQTVNNQDFYSILLDENDVKLLIEQRRWRLVASCKDDNFNQKFWESIIKKIKRYLVHHNEQAFQKKQLIENNHNKPQNKEALLKDEFVQLITRNLSEIQGVNVQNHQADIINEHAYNIYKRFMIFGVQNPDVVNKLYKPITELLQEVKEVDVTSYEIKLVLFKFLLITKDKTDEQDKLIEHYVKVLKNLNIFINNSNLKLNQTQTSVQKYSNIMENEQLSNHRELEKLKQQGLLRNLIAIVVSTLTCYIDFKKSISGDKQLDMIQKPEFLENVLMLIKKLTLRSQSQAQKFVEQVTRIYFFPKTESQLIPSIEQYEALNAKELQKYQKSFSSRTLDYSFQLLVDIIEFMPDSNTQVPIMHFIQTLHSEIFNNTNIQTYRLAKSLNNIDIIKNIKKIMIFLREKSEMRSDTIEQLKQIIEKTFFTMPSPKIFKEFFAFLREIFYYSKDMDMVDYHLACDTLEILNNLMKNNIQDQKAVKSMEQLSINDYFYFSEQTPGIILTDTFRAPQECFTISMLFKVNYEQVKKHYDENKKDSITMTFISFKNDVNQNQGPLQISVHTQKNRIKMFEYDQEIDEQWHLVLLKFKNSKKLLAKDQSKLKIFIDNLRRPIHDQKIYYNFPKNHDFVISYGCSIVEHQDKGSKLKTNDIFHGKMSLLFGFQKFDLEDHCMDAFMKEGYKQFIQNQIQKKQVTNLSSYDVANFYKQNMIKTSKDFPKDFECLNDLNELVIQKHRIAQDLNYICAVHAIRPHQTLVGLGGFKLMYPLFEKSLSSNLTQYQKSDIWKNLFKILRTLMNVEPAHISRLFRNKNLIEIIKYCLIRGGLQNILTKDLLSEVIKILSDIKTNDSKNELEGFYKRYLYDIILCSRFCSLKFTDTKRQNQKSQVFAEVADSLYDKFIDPHKQQLVVNDYLTKILVTEECYNLLMKLIKKFSGLEHLKQTNKLAKIIIRIVLNLQLKDGFIKLINYIQKGTIDSQKIEKSTLKTLLKILSGIISDSSFVMSQALVQSFRTTINIDKLNQHYIQDKASFENNDNNKLRDAIIALTFKIEYHQFKLFYDTFKTRLPDRPMQNSQTKSNFQDDQNAFLKRAIDNIKKNQEQMPMQKTLCTLLLTSFEKATKENSSKNKKPIKYNPQYLIEFAKAKNFLDLINHPRFEKDIFDKVKDLFVLFDFDTKLLFLNFFKQILDERENTETGQMEFMMNVLKQEHNIKAIVGLTLKTKDSNIIEFSERIIASVIKTYLDSSLDIILLRDQVIQYSDDEKSYLKFFKTLLWSLDEQSLSQLIIINDVLRHAQEISIYIEEPKKHETNKVNYNIKLICFLQVIEEIIFRKSKQERIFLDEQFFQILARLLIIFDERQIIYFDYPNPSILDCDRATVSLKIDGSQVENQRLDSKETIRARDFEFIQGGPLRILMSFLLQMIRKYQDHEHQFDWLMQMMKFLLFKEESEFVNQFKVEANSYSYSIRQQDQVPLFQQIFNVKHIKKQGFKLSPLDLTKHYIERSGSFQEHRESMVSLPGFLPFILITEIYEIIRRKLQHEYIGDEPSDVNRRRNQYSIIMKLLQLMFVVIKNSYFIEGYKDTEDYSIGKMVMTITDPRLKENLFYYMKHPIFHSLDQYQKIFFLSKPYHPEIIDYQELDENMKNSYFRLRTLSQAQSDNFSNIEENNTSRDHNEADEEDAKINEDVEADDIFKKADLEMSMAVDNEENRIDMRPEDRQQEKVMKFFTSLYKDLDSQFEVEGQYTSGKDYEGYIKKIKEDYFDNVQSQYLFQAIRKVSSDKLKDSLYQLFVSFKHQEENQKSALKRDEDYDYYYQKNKVPIQRTPKLEPEKNFIASQIYQLGQSQTIPTSLHTLNQSHSNLKHEVNYGDSALSTSQFHHRRVGSVDSQNTFEIYSESGLQKDNYRELTFNNEGNSKEHRTMQYYYTKYQYKKIVRRLQEDQSSLWYDNLEQIKKDYEDLKEIYDLITAPKPGTLHYEETKAKSILLQKAPKIPSSSSYQKRQYDHFVRQRRNTDGWGRMFLLKPDRKYKDTKFWMTHMYFIHDFMKSIMAVSFLEDSDFPDYQQLYLNLVQQQTQQQIDEMHENSGNSQEAANNNIDMMRSSLENAKQLPQSEQLKKLREMLMNKVEQNDFLYSLMMNPDSVVSNDKPFEFHDIDRSIDHSIELEFDIQYIAVEGPYYGKLYISNHYIMFKSKCEEVKKEYRFALHLDLQMKKKDKIWHYNEIEQIFKRRFLLVHQACEIYIKEKKSYFFNFFNEENCNTFFSKIKDIYKNKLSKAEIIINSRDEFKKKGYKNDWIKGDISNQEFLLLVNKYSGRSFNDLTQYPIFPWVIKDYQSTTQKELMEKIESQTQEGLRDLKQHTGCISEQKKQNAINQFRKDEDANMIYGSERFHLKFGFSNKMFSLAYLIRLEPFTDSFIQVNKNLDNPDRIMYNIADQFHSVELDPQNNSELTPEFYYFPEILRNHNLNHFGKNRDGVCVNEVILPSWCRNEHDFIRINREVLDSKHVTMKLTYWLDMLYGAKQAKEECQNIFYCYAYESHVGVKANRDNMSDANIDTIKEFMQVPQQLFKEHLFTEKTLKQIGGMLPAQINPLSMQVNQNYDDIESIEVGTPQTQRNKASGNPSVISQTATHSSGLRSIFGIKKNNAKTTNLGAGSTSGAIGAMSSKDLERIQVGSSLIRRFMKGVLKKEQDLNNICEVHKIADQDRQVFHMLFSLNKCLVFVTDRASNESSGNVRVAGCRESFSQDELKSLCNLGLKVQNLKGDLCSIFQTAFSQKIAQKYPLLYTCQNLDNTIKVYDLNLKKGTPCQVYQEAQNNNVVTVIKFSSDQKYFISGDQDGVIHHYCRNTDDVYDYQSSALASSAPVPKFENKNPAFPYLLKYIIQDHMAAVLAIDMNMTLDMYATASADGNIFIRCLRTSQLWKVIPVDQLKDQNVQVLSLKMSLHGYVFIIIKSQIKHYVYVFSINGDLLTHYNRDNSVFELKYVQLSQTEDQLIIALNQVYNRQANDWTGVIRVLRFFDLEKVEDRIELSYYGRFNGTNNTSGINSSRRLDSAQSSKAVKMPPIRSFTLNQDESKMNVFLANQEIWCFDESKAQIIQQLDDFGLT